MIFDLKDFKGRIALARNFGSPKQIVLATMANETYGTAATINVGYFNNNRPVDILKNEGITIHGITGHKRGRVHWSDDGTICFINGSDTDFLRVRMSRYLLRYCRQVCVF